MNYQEVIKKHGQKLRHYAIYLNNGRRMDADDLLQDTLLIGLEKQHQLNSHKKAYAWLKTTMYRRFLRIRDKKNTEEKINKKMRELSSTTTINDSYEQQTTLLRHVILKDLIHKEIEKVRSDSFFPGIIKYHLMGFIHKETAEKMKISKSTVSNCLSRINKKWTEKE